MINLPAPHGILPHCIVIRFTKSQHWLLSWTRKYLTLVLTFCLGNMNIIVDVGIARLAQSINQYSLAFIHGIVRIVTRRWTGWSRVCIPAGARECFYFPPKCPEPLWNSFNRLFTYLSMRWIPGCFPGDRVDSPTPIAEVKNEKNYVFHPP